MTNAEILSLAYQKQADGDTRSLAEIVAAVRADADALFPPPSPPGPDDVVGGGLLVFPDGRRVRVTVYGDGRRIEQEESV